MAVGERLSMAANLPVKALNAGLFISPGMGIHPDRVIDSHELILVRTGCLWISEGKWEFMVKAGQTLILFPGRRHKGTQEYLSDLSFYWVHFQMMGIKGACREVKIEQSTSPGNPDRIKGLFHQLLSDQKAGRADALCSDLLVMLMLAEVGASHQVRDESAHAAGVVAQAEAWVDANFHLPVSAGDVADAMGYNIDYLSRIFRRHHGQGLTQYLQFRRLREVAGALRDTTLPLKQIALRCGFVDAAYMRRLFVRQKGVTPGVYRKAHSRVHVNVR